MWCFLLFFPSNAFSQEKNGKSYKIGPGDIINLTIIAGGEKQTDVNLVVSEEGEITVPFIGNMKASGFTFKQLERRIYAPLERDYFVDPHVNIQMKEYHSLSFTISGAVEEPGKYELDFHPTLMDLIAKAEGVTAERGNVAYVIRSGQSGNKPERIDLSKLLDQGDMSQNIQLITGDKVHIPLGTKLNQSTTKIYLEGEIERPGMLDYQPGLTALRACIMAGGFGKYAAPNRTKIIRKDGDKGHKVLIVNLKKVKDGKIADIPLKPGDRIHIPETWL